MSNVVDAFMSRVDALASKKEVVITLEKAYDDEAYIVWFERIGGKPGEGFSFLEKVCKFADEMKIVLSLTINPNYKKLVGFYEKLHFVQDGPATNTGISMYRHYDREVYT
jgi:hypothetical protein